MRLDHARTRSIVGPKSVYRKKRDIPHPSTPERKLNNNNNGEERASIEILGEAKTLRGPPESNDDCWPCR